MRQSICQELATRDPILKKIMDTVALPPIESTQNVFHDLLSCIIEQQIHYRSSKKIFQKMLDTAGIIQLTPDNFSSFEEKAFQNSKLSLRKYETIQRIVDFFEHNSIDWQQKSSEEVHQLLSQIKGVGNWTIEMICLYTLGHEDVFPADDYHLKQMLLQLYEVDSSARVKAQLKAIGAAWSPYRSTGVRYLLEWKNYQKKL